MTPFIRLTGLLPVALAVFNVSVRAETASSKDYVPLPPPPAPPFTKTVRVTITALPKGKTWVGGATYRVGPESVAAVNLRWNGYGFIITGDGGTLCRYSDDLAFKGRKTAQFKITRLVSLAKFPDGAPHTVRISNTYTLKRGVKATF